MAYGSEIVGDEIVGALLPRQSYTAAMTRRNVGMGPSGQGPGPQLQRTSPDRLRSYPLGFKQLAILTTASATISRQPQMAFRPQRLIIPSAFAPNFVITDIKVGSNSQLLTSDDFPAQAFSESAVDSALLFDTVDVGGLIAIGVNNISAGTADFRAVLLGVLLK